MDGNRRGDEKREDWLLIKGKDEYANEHGDAALERYQKSVVSSRSLESLASADGKVWNSKPASTSAPRSPKANPRESEDEVPSPARWRTDSFAVVGTAGGKFYRRTRAENSERCVSTDFIAPQLATLVTTPTPRAISGSMK